MLELLVGAALRSLVLATAVWLSLKLPRLRNRQVQLTAWTAVLAISLLMPITTRLAAAVIPAPWIAMPDVEQVLLPRSDNFATPHADVAPEATGQTPILTAIPTRGDPAAMSGSPHRTEVALAGFDWRLFVTLIYAVVCASLLLRLVIGLLSASCVLRAAMPVHESWTTGHHVRVSRDIAAPATFGSVVLLPYDYTTWSPIKRLAVLAHESAHVRRRDFYVQIAARANRALFWFNPLSWWLPRKLSELAEALSDDEAIVSMHDRSAYAEILLEVSSGTIRLRAAVAMARPAAICSRIERILAEATPPARVSRRSQILSITGVLALGIAAAGPLAAVSLPPADDDTASTEPAPPYQRITINPKLLDADVGFYEDMVSGSVMIVTRDGDHLVTGRLGLGRVAEYPYSEHDFFLTTVAQQNTFVTEPSGRIVAVIHHNNGLDTRLERISPETAARLQATYDRRVAEELMPHTPVKLDAAVLEDYVGYYRLAPTYILTVTRDGDQLFVQGTDRKRFPVFPYSVRDFFYTAAAAQLTFITYNDRAATALMLHQNGRDRTAARVGADVAQQLARRLDEERAPYTRVSVDTKRLDRYVGRYTNQLVTMTIGRDGDHLVAWGIGQSSYRIYPYTDHDFFAAIFPTQISFVEDAQGRVTQLLRHEHGEDVALRRVVSSTY